MFIPFFLKTEWAEFVLWLSFKVKINAAYKKANGKPFSIKCRGTCYTWKNAGLDCCFNILSKVIMMQEICKKPVLLTGSSVKFARYLKKNPPTFIIL